MLPLTAQSAGSVCSMEQPILKYRPDEFIVAEAISLSKQCMNNRNPKFRYFRLVKAGFTTFEAVAEIAEFLSVATSRIHYAGLKDEDAITEQFIALDDAAPDQNALQRFNAGHRFGHYRFLELHQHGAGDEQIRVGNL